MYINAATLPVCLMGLSIQLQQGVRQITKDNNPKSSANIFICI